MPKKLFEKGKSGNPGGRPKESVHFSILARLHSEEALNVLVVALSSKVERNRIMAANIIIDRAWGKPTQEVTGLAQQIVVMNEIKKNDDELRFNVGTSENTGHSE